MTLAPHLISTLVIGPQAGGRGYRVLARSEGRPISAAAEGRLSELPLVLAGWADEREPHGVALVPLADATAPALLMRFAYLSAAQLGTIAYAHGLLLDEAAFAACGGRPEALLPLVPPPDGSWDFAAAPLALPASPPDQPLRRDWSGLGLEWRDRLVLVADEGDAEPILRSVLAALGPAAPGARVRGWATTALLPPAGSFAPPRELQLLVVDAARRRPAGLHHLQAFATATGFDGERVAPSPAARAFDRIKSLGGLDADLATALATLRWSPSQFDADPPALLQSLADIAIRRLQGGGAQMRFVIELARPRGDTLDGACAAVARHLFVQLLGRPGLEPQHGAFYIKAIADGPADSAAAIGPLGPLLLSPGSARWLRGATFTRLVELGWIEAAAERADAAPELLAGFATAELSAVLDHVMLSSDERLRAPALVSAALRLLADQADEEAEAAWAGIYEAALRWRLAAPASPDERRLASRSVVRATHRLVRPLMAPLAARCLSLRHASEFSAHERLDMLGGALEWVRLEGAPV